MFDSFSQAKLGYTASNYIYKYLYTWLVYITFFEY